MTLIVHGVKVPLSPADVSSKIWQVLSNGTYEAKEARWISMAVRPNDRVLELGCGLGVLTSLIAGIEGVHVWAFDANPTTLRLARRVIEANELENITLAQGILAAGHPREFEFYVRKDLWMSSVVKHQGPYEETMTVTSTEIDEFILQHQIDVVVMDVEGAEHDMLIHAEFPGIDRIFLELHDHLYGLAGIRNIMRAMVDKGFSYDPRGSSGSCVLFSRDDYPREFQPDDLEHVR